MSKKNRKPYTESYIRTYKNVIDPRVCEELIHTYEKIWGDNQEEIMKTSLCYNPDGTKFCAACNCDRLDLTKHKDFKELMSHAMSGINKSIQMYKEDCSITTGWPKQIGYESPRIKRYLPDNNQQHDLHSDVTNKDNAKRFVSMVAYLNDDFEGGETTVPNFGYKSKVSTGAVMMFPTTWCYLHKGNPVRSGSPKYVLATFLHYLSGTVQKGYQENAPKVL